MKHLPKHIILIGIIIILHTVGVIGILIPATHNLTLSLTPINLLISLSILIYADSNSSASMIRALLLCFSIGFLVEMLGVQTGFPFGNYSYGSTLGPKVFGTPLIIGVNWFLLSYLFFQLYRNLKKPPLRVIAAATSMMLMDFLIEPVAIELGYWGWTNASIPWQNYASWWVISLVMQVILHKFIKPEANPVVKTLLLSQLIFFLLIFFI